MSENLKSFRLDEITNIKINGRTAKNQYPLALFWTGSGFEVNIRASELWMEVEIDYNQYEQWISIEINGAAVSRQMLIKGKYPICIFRGMNNQVVKNVKIYKDVQPMSEDDDCIFLIHSLKTDGEFEKVKDKKMKIEFIGDSITSGEGTIGAKEEEEWISMWFTSLNNYAVMTAKKLDADFRIIAQSGWGVLSGWDNNPNAAIPKYYEKVCGVVNGEKNKKLSAYEKNDFASWKPDVIVVNLGTNDGGAFNSPEFRNEKTGEIFKQHINEDGTYNEIDVKRFENAVIDFLYKLRKYNKDSKILWAYGMLGIPMMQYIYRAVYKYKMKTKDNNVSITQLTNTTHETVGSRSHPGLLNHKIAAEQLVDIIRNL